MWRQKEQFSDGVGYGWIDSLKKEAESSVTDLMMRYASSRFPVSTPQSKEEYMYRYCTVLTVLTVLYCTVLY